MQLVRINPFFQLSSFPQAHNFRFHRRRNSIPLTDFYENAESFLIKMDLPGINRDDIHIDSDNETMEISVQYAEEITESNETTEQESSTETERKPIFYLRERRSGEFTRRINFPTAVAPSDSNISFENGVLSIEVPKAEEAKRISLKID